MVVFKWVIVVAFIFVVLLLIALVTVMVIDLTKDTIKGWKK